LPNCYHRRPPHQSTLTAHSERKKVSRSFLFVFSFSLHLTPISSFSHTIQRPLPPPTRLLTQVTPTRLEPCGMVWYGMVRGIVRVQNCKWNLAQQSWRRVASGTAHSNYSAHSASSMCVVTSRHGCVGPSNKPRACPYYRIKPLDGYCLSGLCFGIGKSNDVKEKKAQGETSITN